MTSGSGRKKQQGDAGSRDPAIWGIPGWSWGNKGDLTADNCMASTCVSCLSAFPWSLPCAWNTRASLPKATQKNMGVRLPTSSSASRLCSPFGFEPKFLVYIFSNLFLVLNRSLINKMIRTTTIHRVLTVSPIPY